MKTRSLFLVPVLMAVLNLIPAGQAPAQTFTSLGNLYGSFDSPIFLGNTLYASLHGLVLSGNTFYGTSPGDDETGYSGMVYAVSTDGTGFTNVHSFGYVVAPGYGPRINADGAFPNAGLILSGATLYGTTYYGGSSGNGTIFKASTNGTGFTVLNIGGNPQAGLTLSGSTLYGTTYYGGSAGAGSVFAVNTNGTGFTNLHSFTATSPPGHFDITNTNSDGASPAAGVILSGSTLYGTAYYGGSGGAGTVFAVNADGTSFRVLHNFTALSSGYYGTNSDGGHPQAGLVLSGNTLYGTASQGGSSGSGTVFAVRTNGTGFTNLHSFTGSDGLGSPAGLILSGNTLYGTASGGVFSLSFAPRLTITPSGVPLSGIILSWPTNVAGSDSTGYTLQSTTNLDSPFWSTNSPAPVVIAGQNTLTNSITGAQQFYRLIR